jgi:hypothetical protein
MSNATFQSISTRGPGAGLSLREDNSPNPSKIEFVPFSYTFSNTAGGVYDTGVRLPVNAIVLYSVVKASSTALLSDGATTIQIGTASTAGGAVTTVIVPANTGTLYNVGVVTNTGIATPAANYFLSLTTSAAMVSGTINGRIFYTSSVA